jgi:uncharacterized protein YdeI (YjbR/CyaY-like superfamily)
VKTSRDPRIDAFIAKSAPFARPILSHLRELVHRACPPAEETLKWGMPAYTHQGILCITGAFKAHCTFIFWHGEMKKILARDGAGSSDAMGVLGRITTIADLPKDAAMLRYLKEAVRLNESGVPTRARFAKTKPPTAVPADLKAALKKNPKAAATFEKLSPSHRREYVEWITEAKRDETRQKRLATTLEWLTAGKPRNWKYEK